MMELAKSSNLFVPALLVLLLVGFYKIILYPVFLSPLAKIPSAHPLASVTSAWISWTRYHNNENRTIHAAHKRLGDVVRIGPSELSINCVDDGIKTVYGKGFEKIPFYSFFANYGILNMFSTLQSKPHAIKKKRISNIYSKSHLQSSADIQAITATLIHKRLLPIIFRKCSASELINVYELFQAAAMDSATAYFFGLPSSTNFLEVDEKRGEWLQLYLRSRPREYMFFLQEFPKLTSWLGTFGVNLVPRSRHAINDEVDAWCLAMCDGAERMLSAVNSGMNRKPGHFPVVYEQIRKITVKEGMSTASDVHLDAAASRHNGTEVGRVLSVPRSKQQLEIASELLDQLIATHETFGITLLYVSWELSRNPLMQQRLRHELLQLGSSLLLDETDEQVPAARIVDELPLLHAILMETLRLHAAVPGGQPRVTPPKSQTKLGSFTDIPEDIRISAYAWNLHRNPEVFPKPEEWHPERWLEDDPDSKRWEGSDKKERWFWAFGSGGRMCIGSNFAMQMMKFIVAAIYTNFTTTIVDDEGIEQDDGFIAGPKGDKLILQFHAVRE